ncbi:MAG TPA: serine/threonine-protein kinase, partial [Thermoanaerobaculia bacterium]|nr:serine/threonine-protein kinase [Thermoanaerobaculia bacterium]
MTTPQRWNEVKALLAEALETTAERRAELLAAADPELASQVERYLALDTQLGDFIERPAFDLHDDVDPAVRVGERLGPYRLAREIGSGGMGAVYQAVRADEEYEHSVAIKVLKRGLDTAEVIHRFRNERQILAGLEHPHVARLMDGGTTPDGRPYLVMEYVEGQPIDVWCHERGLSVDERLELFLAVCEGVKFAHRNLVVHRDLKPSNILITEDGTPKLLDFGIARLLDTEGPSLPTVGAWRFLTPEYASPEQVTGRPITTATDVYSLGILLYLLLTDRRPYDLEERSARGLAALFERGEEPARPSTVAPEERRKRLRGDLDNIALTALRREPERRYGSAGELADDVRRHVDGLPVKATPDSWRYRAGKFVKRHRVGVAAVVVIGVLLVGFLVVTWVLMEQEEQQKRRAQETLSFLEGLIREADPDQSQGAELTVRELLDKAVTDLSGATQEDVVIADPFVKSQLLQTIGEAYFSNGAVKESQHALLQALQIRETIF